MNRKAILSCFLGLLSTIMIAVPARAQTLRGDFTLDAVAVNKTVQLNWQQPSGFKVSYYLVYKADIITTMPPVMAYRVIDSTTTTAYVDTVSRVFPALFQGYRYLVRAFNSAGDSLSSNVAVVGVRQFFLPATDRVKIESHPPLYATVDSLYMYQVKAVSDSSSAVLHYSLGEHPAAMVIDSTGKISWTPKASGYSEVEVFVTSSLGGRARQEYVIRTSLLDATIEGSVTDTLGNPVARVAIHVYGFMIRPVPLAGHLIAPIPIFRTFSYKAMTDSSGHYSISHVDEGRYYVRAVPLDAQYMPEWYDNVVNRKNATLITISKDTTVTADFMLRNRVSILPRYTVSGTVKDTLGNPIPKSVVIFARAGFMFNGSRDDQHQWSTGESFRDFFSSSMRDTHASHNFGIGNARSPFVFVTHTDSAGVYSVTLPQGRYIALAEAKGYYKTFFDGKSNFLSADIISLASDTSGIDFKLSSIPQIALGQLSGSVIDTTTGLGVAARLVAFRDIWNHPDTLKMHIRNTYFTDADTTGSYTFADLPPGYYKILALPLGNYMPSFYSTAGPTVRWKQATALRVDGNVVSGVNIDAVPLPDSASGYTSISGRVTSSVTGEGVSGALVYSADANGNISGYGITNSTGDYTITGIAPGTFNVFTDVVGYTSSGSKTSIPGYSTDGGSIPSTSNFSVTPDAVTGIQPTAVKPTNFELDQNYPNPFNPTTQISFSIPSAMHVSVTIFNILGQRIATLVDANMSAGSHVVTWNARNGHGETMPSGVYFYRLSTPSFTAVKKMLLLK